MAKQSKHPKVMELPSLSKWDKTFKLFKILKAVQISRGEKVKTEPSIYFLGMESKALLFLTSKSNLTLIASFYSKLRNDMRNFGPCSRFRSY